MRLPGLVRLASRVTKDIKCKWPITRFSQGVVRIMLLPSVRCRHFLSTLAVLLGFCVSGILLQVQAQDQNKDSQKGAAAQDQSQDPLKRPLPPGKRDSNKVEPASKFYKRWMDEDVRWIITD